MQKIIQNIASDELIPALESNMVAFWSAYGRANGCTLQATSEVVWFYTGIPVPLCNGVLFAKLNPNEVKGIVDRLQSNIMEQGAPALWWIGPQSKPAQIGSLLEQHGLRPAGEVPGMAMELAGMQSPPEMPPGFMIQKVRDIETQKVWARIAAVGTGFSDTTTDALVQIESTLSDPGYKAQERYLGYLDGIPVATSALVLDSGVAGIYAVATIPTARRKGIGQAMTVMPFLEARRQGYRVGILQASDMGYPVYQKIGFKDVCLYKLYIQSA